jgi:hypothetical protein
MREAREAREVPRGEVPLGEVPDPRADLGEVPLGEVPLGEVPDPRAKEGLSAARQMWQESQRAAVENRAPAHIPLLSGVDCYTKKTDDKGKGCNKYSFPIEGEDYVCRNPHIWPWQEKEGHECTASRGRRFKTKNGELVNFAPDPRYEGRLRPVGARR